MSETSRRAQIAKERALSIMPQPTTRDETRAGIMLSLRVSERDAKILMQCLEAGDDKTAEALTTEYLMRDDFLGG